MMLQYEIMSDALHSELIQKIILSFNVDHC